MAEENKIFELYHRVHKELLNNVKRIAEPYEFSRGELPILVRLIKGGDGVIQKEILNKLPISKSTVSKTINNLVKKGYLKKEKDPGDRRSTRIYLTDKGRKAENTIREIVGKVESIMVKGLSDEEREELTEYLERLLENLKE